MVPTQSVTTLGTCTPLTNAPPQTLSIFWSFILVMVLHPDTQRRAQKHVDEVCDGRLPNFDDIGCIPYVDALVKECLRLNPVVSMSASFSSFAARRIILTVLRCQILVIGARKTTCTESGSSRKDLSFSPIFGTMLDHVRGTHADHSFQGNAT